MSKTDSKLAIVVSGSTHFIGKIWADGKTPTQIRDATPVLGGLVNTPDNRVALQVMTPPYGCAEGTLKVLHLGSADSWIFVDDLSKYDQATVKDFMDRKAKSDASRRAEEAGLVLPRGMSPDELTKIARGPQ